LCEAAIAFCLAVTTREKLEQALTEKHLSIFLFTGTKVAREHTAQEKETCRDWKKGGFEVSKIFWSFTE